MAKFIETQEKNTITKYSDGKTLESKMLMYAKGSNVSFKKNESWPVTYHFSKYREGILNWYPFKKDCTILEIGSGCGAITKMLCEKAKKVVSIELEYSRAIINYERNYKLSNLEIIVGDINKIEINEKFDYVILNGVLEYAQHILDSKDENAYSKLLSKSKTYMKNNGTLLLAIENRLGIKYLAGRKEDHLSNIYSGINGYINSDIRTFSRQELIDLVNKAGCKISKWYYPYPDYKFPFEIFTDKTINKIYPTMLSLPLDFDQIEFIDSDSLYRSLMKNKIMENFANSFLIEISKNKQNDIDYVKISSIRKDMFSICTMINYSEGIVYKNSIYGNGIKHIQNLCKNNYRNNLLNTIEYKYKNNCALCEIINGNTLLDEVIENNELLFPIVKKIYSSLITSKAKIKKPSKAFINVFGNVKFDSPLHWINNVNIDLQLSNIYVSNNKFLIIDPEWQFEFYVPVEYIIWRILFNLPQTGICDRKYIKNKIKHFDIDPNLCSTFEQMEHNFVFNYVGYKELPYKKLRKIDINTIINK